MQMYEAMFRVIKESENVDERQHCFLIQSFGKESHYFSVETRQVIVRWRVIGDNVMSILLGIAEIGISLAQVSLPGNIPTGNQNLSRCLQKQTLSLHTR